MSEHPVSKDAFREALSQFASGVTVVAVQGPTGPLGLTATAFSSVSLDPPLVLVCVAHKASARDAVLNAEAFGISVLGEGQAWIAEQIAESRPDRFVGVPVRAGHSLGAPLVDGAVASLECRPYARHQAGDHTILVGEVRHVSIERGRPLVHFARRFGGVTDAVEWRVTPVVAGAQADAAAPKGAVR